MIHQEPSKIYSSISTRLETQHQSIPLIVSTIDSKRIEFRPEQGKWNIHEMVAHLVAYQQMYMERIVQTLKEEVPFFVRYDAYTDSDFEYWCTNDMEHLMAQHDSDRQKFAKIIGDLTEEEANRIAMHKRYGSHTITQWMEFFLLHEAHHIYKIFQLAYNIELK
jgi:Protein of unknown function (DUF664).